MNSQIGQDQWVCDFFQNKKEGFFLDIGAFDGKTISNTYHLEQLGWKGICVEAGEENFAELEKNRKCQLLNVAVSDFSGYVKFGENHTVGKIGEGDQVVLSLTFSDLIVSFGVPFIIDYISLDIEGAELSALKTFPFKDYEAILWTIEHNAHLDGGKMRDEIREMMKGKGYNLHSSGHNFEDWYINERYDNNESSWQTC
jgi:FkbM family methyltransferase